MAVGDNVTDETVKPMLVEFDKLPKRIGIAVERLADNRGLIDVHGTSKLYLKAADAMR